MKGKSYKLVDLITNADYDLPMDTQANTYSDDIELLEKTIQQAVELISKYKNENLALKQRMDILAQEKTQLMQKNDQAKSRLESMINRLKSLEQKSS